MTYSKSKHYNHTEPEVDLTAGVERDGVGLVQAICMKVRFCHYIFNLSL